MKLHVFASELLIADCCRLLGIGKFQPETTDLGSVLGAAICSLGTYAQCICYTVANFRDLSAEIGILDLTAELTEFSAEIIQK